MRYKMRIRRAEQSTGTDVVYFSDEVEEERRR